MSNRAFHRARTTLMNPTKGLVRGVAFALAGLVVAGSAVALTAAQPAAQAATAPTMFQCSVGTGYVFSAADVKTPSSMQTATVAGGKYTVSADATKIVSTAGVGLQVNAVGYNPNDGFMYGMETNGSNSPTNQFVRIGANGVAQELGVVGDGKTDNTYDGGVITTDSNGQTIWIGFLRTTGSTQMTKVVIPSASSTSLASGATSVVQLSGASLGEQPRDVAFNRADGLMYALVSTGFIYSISTSGAVAKVTTTPTGVTAFAGGAWNDSFGNLFFYQNAAAAGHVYEYTTDKQVVDLGTTPQSYSFFDATACLPLAMQKTVSPSPITPGKDATFTFSIANPYTSAVTITNFADTLASASGLTWKAVPSSSLFADSSVTRNGTSLSISPITLPANSTSRFTATASVTNPTKSGNYTNQSSFVSNGVTILSDDPDQPGATDTTPFTVNVPAPNAVADTPATYPGKAVTFDPTVNDGLSSSNAALDKTKTVLLDGTTPKTSLTTADGAYSVDTSTGFITFTPNASFTSGSATAPVTYRIQDANNAVSTATITPSVSAFPTPKAVADAPETTENTPRTFDPTANDTNATSGGGTIVPSSTRLLDEQGNPTTSRETTDGTYSVNTSTGQVTFTPAAGVTGTAKVPVGYRITDTNGATADSTITPVITASPAPKATPDTPETEENSPVTFDPAENDTVATSNAAIDRSRTTLLDEKGTAVPTLTTVDGTYTVDATTGMVTFDPAKNVVGTATVPVSYRITDANGATATSTITPTITPVTPTATDDSATTKQGSSVSFDVVGDDVPGNAGTPIDTSSVLFSNGTTSITTDEGEFTVDTKGTVTFTPTDPGFVGTATTPYTVAGVDGRRSAAATLTVTITPVAPVATDNTTSTEENTPVTVDVIGDDRTGVTGGKALDPTSVRLGTVDGGTLSTDGKKLTVPGVGTWTVDPATGTVAFAPAMDSAGATPAVPYTVADGNGTRSNTATLTVTVTAVKPTATPDTVTTTQGEPVDVPVLRNDLAGNARTPLTASSVTLTKGDSDGVVSDGGKKLVVDGEGTYTVAADGTVTFAPVPSFTGTATPVGYTVTAQDGKTASSTITPTVTAVGPKTMPDAASGTQGKTITVKPLDNDATGVQDGSALKPSTVTLQARDSGGRVEDDGKTLVIDGVGTFTVASDGVVTFTPATGTDGPYSGTVPTIGYTVEDTAGASGSSTIDIVIDPTVPVANADTTTTPESTPVDVHPLGNDVPQQDGPALDPDSLVLTVPTDAPAGTALNGDGTLTIPDVGTFAITSAAGTAAPVVTFTPVDGFVGTAVAGYTVRDGNRRAASSTITVEVTGVPPVAAPDSGRTEQNTPVTVDLLGNDGPGARGGADLDPSSVVLTAPASGGTVSDGGKRLVVDGVGTWTVDDADGSVTFAPAQGFASTKGRTVPDVAYTVADTTGRTVTSTVSITVTPVVPVATDDADTTAQGTPVTVATLSNDHGGNEATGLDAGSVAWVDLPGGATLSDGDATLTVPGEGSYTIAPTTGDVTFTPVPAFSGHATAVRYRVADVDGGTGTAAIRITVTPVAPRAADDTAELEQNDSVAIPVLTNDRAGIDGGTPLVAASVVFTDAPAGAVIEADGKKLTMPGEGVYTIDPVTGVVTFASTSRTGALTPVTYAVTDEVGETSTASITVTVTPTVPVAADDTASTGQDLAVTLRPAGNDTAGNAGTPLVAGSIVLGAVGSAQPADGGRSLVVAGQGSYAVTEDGDVVFTPERGYHGTATAVPYTITDAAGNTASATITVTVTPVVPTATADTATTLQDTPVSVQPLANDRAGRSDIALVPGSVQLTTTGLPSGSVLTNGGRTVTVPGEGSYTADATSGLVTFTPVRGFHGTATPVTYTVADADATTASATITVTVTHVEPTAAADVASTRQGRAVTIDPLTNDTAGGVMTPLDRTTVRLTATGLPAGTTVSADGRSLAVPGEGTYTVDATTGSVRFAPVTTFTGVASVVTYTVADVDGQVATATIAVSVTPAGQVARPDSASTRPGQSVTIDPVSNDIAPSGAAWDRRSVLLVIPAGMTGATLSADQRTLTVPGEGVWTVDPASGEVTFTPAAGFSGTATPIEYSVADVDGVRVVSTVTVDVAAAAVPTADPSSPVLAFTGSDPGATVGIALALVLGGVALALVTAIRPRRRATWRR